MNKRITYIAIILAVLLAAIFTGCPMTLDPVDSSKDPTGDASIDSKVETGITITVPRYAPWILEASSSSNAHALAFTDAVEIIVKNSSDTVIYRNTFNPGIPDGTGRISCSVAIAPGTGYSLTVNIFNNNNSTTIPVVSGTSSGINVTAGNATAVSVTCLPVNPVIVAADTTCTFTDIIPVTLDNSGGPATSGTELWYQITAPSTGYLDLTVNVPEDISFYYIAFGPDGTAAGTPVMAGPGSRTIGMAAPAGQVVYLALAVISANSSPVSGSASWTEVTPHYLTETDVPDAELRRLLEYYTNKQFPTTANPNPANQVTDLDLEALTSEFRTDGYNGGPVITGIENLTGLEYCDNIHFLLLNNNNLSGGSANLSVISQMDGLNAVDMVGCSIENLDFLSGISALKQLKVWGNSKIEASDIQSITAANFPNIHSLGFSAWDMDDNGVDVVSPSEWTGIVNMLAEHTSLDELGLSSFGCSSAMVTQLTDVITTNPTRWIRLGLDNFDASGNSGITDLSWVINLTGLRSLDLSGNTNITDLTPLQTLYTNGGLNTQDWSNWDLILTNCNLDLWPGSPNRAVVDYLISHGVRVDYEDGNNVDMIREVGELLFDDPDIKGYVDVVAMGDRVFVDASYLSGEVGDSLACFDISDPSNPVDQALLDMPGILQRLAIDNNYVYASVNMSDGSYQLSIVDISNPTSPQLRGSLSMKTSTSNGVASGIVASNGYVYYMINDTGLRIIDVSDMDNPRIVGEYSDSDTLDSSVDYYNRNTAVSIDSASSRAYIGGGQAYDMKILNISDKTSPTLVSTLDTGSSYVTDLCVDSNYAYVTNSGEKGFKIIDISDENFPYVVGTYYDGYWMNDVVLIGNTPVIHVHGGLRVIDVSDPSNPQNIQSFSDSDSPTCGFMFYNGTYLLTNGGNANEVQGVKIIEVHQ